MNSQILFLGSCGVDAGSKQSQEVNTLNMKFILNLFSNTGLQASSETTPEESSDVS